MKRLVLYHADCIDGWTAAWCAWRKFGDGAEYVPAKYGQPQPDVTGRDVLILDFSYPRATLIEMAEKSSRLRLFDHHLTAQKDIEGFVATGHIAAPGRFDVVFDMERSGAGITWDVLHGNAALGWHRPLLVDYVEDRDLWRFKLPGSKRINAYIGATARDSFATWDRLAEEVGNATDWVREMGAAIELEVCNFVREMSGQARTLRVDGYDVPVVNTPYVHTSEVVGELAKTWPFAVGWFQRGDGRFQYSLRSRGELDVSDVARRFGGGGHAKAAGFVADVAADQLFGGAK